MAIHSVRLLQLNKARVVAILTPHSRRAPPLFAGLFLFIGKLILEAPMGAKSNQMSDPFLLNCRSFSVSPHQNLCCHPYPQVCAQ
jgi:hypothetical protein